MINYETWSYHSKDTSIFLFRQLTQKIVLFKNNFYLYFICHKSDFSNAVRTWFKHLYIKEIFILFKMKSQLAQPKIRVVLAQAAVLTKIFQQFNTIK
jgi:hypothetical protein